MTDELPREKRPTAKAWVETARPRATIAEPNIVHSSGWMLGGPSGIRVVSTLTIAELPDGSGETGPQWHVSISRYPHRASARDVTRVLYAFDLQGAEEDNHEPGTARHFWMPVDPARRVDCECKTTEQVIVEADGHRWTNPTPESGEPCRGCEFEKVMGKLGRPCPLHSGKEA